MKRKIYFFVLSIYLYLVAPVYAMDWPGQELNTKGQWGNETAGLGMCKCQLDEDPKDDVIFAWIDDPGEENSIYYRIILNGDKLITAADSYLSSANGWMNSGLGLACGNIDMNQEPDMVFVWVDNQGDSRKIDGNAFNPNEPIDGVNYIYYMIAYNLHKEGNQYKFRSKSRIFNGPDIGMRTQGLGAVLLNMDSDSRLELLVAYIDAPTGTNYVHFKAIMNFDHNKSTKIWIGSDKKIPLGHHNQGLGMDLIKLEGKQALALAIIDNPDRNNKFHQTFVYNIGISNNKVVFDKAETRIIKQTFGYEDQGAAFVALNEKYEQYKYIESGGSEKMLVKDYHQYDFVHLTMDNPTEGNMIDTFIQEKAPPAVKIDQEQTARSKAASLILKSTRQSFKPTMSCISKIEICVDHHISYSMMTPRTFSIRLNSSGSNSKMLARTDIPLTVGSFQKVWYVLDIDPAIKLTPGDEYNISIDPPFIDNRIRETFLWGIIENNPYKNGMAYINETAHPDEDFQFRVWGFHGDHPYEGAMILNK